MVALNLILDEGARMLWVECVLHLYRDILHAYRIYRRRVDHLCTEVTKLHSLYVRKLVDGICRLDDARVCCHEAVNVCPNLKYVCIKGGSDDSCCIVRTTTTEVRYLVGVLVARDEAWNEAYSWKVCESLTDEFVGKLCIKYVLTHFALSLDEIA